MDLARDLVDFQKDVSELASFRTSIGRRRKTFRPRLNPMIELSDAEFKMRYRFSKNNMRGIVELLRSDLQRDSRGCSVPIELQVMAVIRYWGRHEIQEDCADLHGISQPTMSRLASRVASALASKRSQFIKMPSSAMEEATAIQKFYAIAGMRGINGAIDCTHVKIRKVGGNAGQYHINRKGLYSINTQVVCDADLKICDIVCRWRGSTHDARIFRESSIKRRFEEGEFVGKLIGDSGYPLSPHVLIPRPRPVTAEDQQFNYCHILTRNVVERCFGTWKQRFRILLEVMRGSYHTIKTTIIACAVLHNLAIIYNEEDTMESEVE